ncbi:MAG TPA: DUF998 domain-containing protein [Vicinamibacterales bacterium]|nr:DUF998 domain-containing protein [Vicinamibacterales bacterium]
MTMALWPGSARQTAWAGATAPILFVAVFLLEDVFSPGFNWLSTPVSEHSFGPHGWMQISTFVVTGLLLLAFASGVAREFGRDGLTLGPRFLAILGWCILLSGPFVADPTPAAVYSREATWHGIVHGILGAIAFTLMPASCFVFYRRFRKDARWRPLATWTVAACVVIVSAIVLLKIAQLGPLRGLAGLFQRMILVTFFGWTFVFGVSLGSVPLVE